MPDHAALSEIDEGRPGAVPGNLKWRIISGSVLAAIALAFAYAGAKPFALLVLVVALFLSWEWGRMVRGTASDLAFYVHAVAVSAAIVLAVAGYAAISIAVLVTAAIIMIPLAFGRGARLSALGIFYVGVPAVALLWLRADEPYGFAALLLVFAIVWSSDIAAYAAGRAIGGPKLWPRVSPKKTWSGFIGGCLAAGAAACAFTPFLEGASPVRLALTGIGLALVAQLGDLAESALKRLFGRKDASSLIPGHGGFMDRMDSIVAVATVAALLALAIDAHAPARALLFGS